MLLNNRNYNMPGTRVTLAYRIALFIFHEARHLVRMGTAQDLDGTDMGNVPMLNSIPIDSEQYRFVEALVRFARYIAQVMNDSLLEGEENIDPQDITNIFNNIDQDNEI